MMDSRADACTVAAKLPWFAIRVRSNFEHFVATSLHNRGYEEYLPLYRLRHRTPARVREAEFPLFPGYVFGRFDLNGRLPILTVPGVVHIVGAGRVPVPVDEAELNAVRAALDSRLRVQPWPFLNVGDRVVLQSGPLRGLEGILAAAKDDFRLVVSMTLLQRSVAVEIDREWVQPLRHPCARIWESPLAAANPGAGEAIGQERAVLK